MSSFADQLRIFEAKTIDKMSRVARKITLDAFSGCIMMSPVDTGRFRGNWQTAVGQEPSGTVDLLDPSGNVVIAKVSGAVAGMQIGDVVYMVNNLPYAQPLEDGSSSQAPNGMVKLTVQRFQPIAQEAIRLIGAE